MSSPAIARTSVQLYRDCLRLAKHVGGNSAKSMAIRQTVRLEFEKNKDVTDPEQLEMLKGNAIRGLSNYLVFANSGSDARLKEAMQRAEEQTAIQNAEWKDVSSF